MVCTPCNQMERIRPGLRKELWGRRGMLCRALEGGIIRPGDFIEKISAPHFSHRQNSVFIDFPSFQS